MKYWMAKIHKMMLNLSSTISLSNIANAFMEILVAENHSRFSGGKNGYMTVTTSEVLILGNIFGHVDVVSGS